MKTMVLGATPNETRYANIASKRLVQHGHAVVLLGIKKGSIDGQEIINTRPLFSDIDTVTLYINPANQVEWYDYIIKLHPRRIIFNPGTENPEFMALAKQNNIETTEACTLVMLAVGTFDSAAEE